MSRHHQVLDHFHKRLLAAVTRSPLLKATVPRIGRLLDCSRFEAVEAGLGTRVLRTVVEGSAAVPLDLRLRFSHSGSADDQEIVEGRVESADDKIVRQHRAIYDALDRSMRRFAELVKRETGVHSLWLGYPLLYVVTGEGEAQQWILAPVFLWPTSIELGLRHEGRVLIRYDPSAGGVKFNRAMAGWLNRQLNLALRGPEQDELERLNWDGVKRQVDSLAQQFHDPPSINCDDPLEPVPNAKLLSPQQSPKLFNSAVLGIYRWQNEAILADLEELQELDQINGVLSGFTTGEALPQPPAVERPAEADRYQVYDADFSQERVIWQARTEPGVVVHGPPGTGKSQTIVNVIADALGHGRTILMVCQKYAATRVVFEKLKQVGLDGLCLEVTDTEKDRLSVFEAIRDQVDALPTAAFVRAPTSRIELARDISELEDELDEYSRAMYEREDTIGLAYRELKAKEGAVYAKFPTVRVLPSLHELAVKLSWQQLDGLRRGIEQAGRLFAGARPLTNPWRFAQPAVQPTAALMGDISAHVARLRDLDAAHSADVEANGAGAIVEGQPSAFNDIGGRIVAKIRDLARDPKSPRAQLFRAWIHRLHGATDESRAGMRSHVEAAVALARRVVEAPLDPAWHAHYQNAFEAKLAALDKHAQCVIDLEGRWWRFLSFRFRRARRVILESQPAADEAAVGDLARQALSYVAARSIRRNLRLLNQRLVPNLRPTEDELANLKFPAVALEEFKWVEGLSVPAQDDSWLQNSLAELSKETDFQALERLAENLDRARQRVAHVEALLVALESLDPYLGREALAEPERLVRRGSTISPWLNDLVSGLERFPALLAWNLTHSERTEPLRGIVGALEEYELNRLNGQHVPVPPSDLSGDDYGTWWISLVEYAATLGWQAQYHRKWPILVSVTPGLHAQKVHELGRLIDEKRNLEAEDIRARWLQKQIPHRSAPWKKMFQLRRSKYGEAKRLREGVSLSLPEGLLAMRPCWLVNPGTAAEIFPLVEGLFDLVIFDEASQCPIEQAVPAIFRGQSLVVSGDEKQLPPTSFFTSSWNTDQQEEEVDEEATDKVVSRDDRLSQLNVAYLLQVEDLLAAAIGNLPERYLSVHYRSRHPALIQFSNRAFYNGRLEAPPSRVSSVNGYRPIRFHEVSGLYERRTNRDEAQFVIELFKEIWAADACPTIGVVTFNQPQRDLIEDLIEQQCQQDDAFRVRYQQEASREEDNQDVGLFIKNLENVQGDERDLMIFSTTFGRDGQKRFYRRFGPVGAVGGERRLNVAVTRAKQQVFVVTSMPVQEIASALSADLAPGSQLTPAGYLQLYMAYAKAVSDGDQDRIDQVLDRAGHKAPLVTSGDAESPFEEDVRDVLEKLGFTVHSQVGDSGFRIDLGVMASDPRLGYILGIECDGAAYHSDRTARLRDVWRAKILRGRGWRLHRIWSTHWWYHRGEEIESLKHALEKAQEHFEQEKSAARTSADESLQRPCEGHRESWQMSLADWKRLREELQARGDEEALRAMGALGTDAAHRYQVEQGIKQGKPVPKEVLDEYPDLTARQAQTQDRLFEKE